MDYFDVVVIGGGLAGSEAAWQLATRGVSVQLLEMRPDTLTPAHRTGLLAELVCSNSLKSNELSTAAGLLKEELRRLGSLVVACADCNRVPAGAALAVDRNSFAKAVTRVLESHPCVSVRRREVRRIDPTTLTVVATGPLTSNHLERAISRLTGQESLHFFDAAAPIVEGESVDRRIAFKSSRYGKGGDDYLNCPLDEESYSRFWEALVSAETVPLRDFERKALFSACMPIEELARQGRDTLRYGPLKPVGLTDPRTGKRPYAVVQLRREDAAARLFNIVGFQTNLRWGEQKRVFGMIPGLANAEFVRYGVMHRNTYVNSPEVLEPTLSLRLHPMVYLAGTLAGVEGYVESAGCGLVAALNVWARLAGVEPVLLPDTSAMGSLLRYITSPQKEFQPMHANFGLVPPLAEKVRGKHARYAAYAERALRDLDEYLASRPELTRIDNSGHLQEVIGAG